MADSDLQSVVPTVAEVLERALAVEHHCQSKALLIELLHSGVQFPVVACDVGLDVDGIQGLAVVQEVPVCDSGLDTVLADSTRQVAALLVLKKEADGFGGGFNVLVDSVHGQILHLDLVAGSSVRACQALRQASGLFRRSIRLTGSRGGSPRGSRLDWCRDSVSRTAC